MSELQKALVIAKKLLKVNEDLMKINEGLIETTKREIKNAFHIGHLKGSIMTLESLGMKTVAATFTEELKKHEAKMKKEDDEQAQRD